MLVENVYNRIARALRTYAINQKTNQKTHELTHKTKFHTTQSRVFNISQGSNLLLFDIIVQEMFAESTM